MFQKIEALSPERHMALRFNRSTTYRFAENMTAAPLTYKELQQAARYYPIVFSSAEEPVPQALLSVGPAQNAYVSAEGRWRVPYVPAHVRRYPFILGKTDEEGNYALCIDPDAPHFQFDQGEPLFTANGDSTDLLNQALEFVKTLQQEFMDTRKILAPLPENSLLESRQLNIRQHQADAAPLTVKGMYAVDMKKLREMDAETLGEWVKNGLMGLVYAHQASLANLQAVADIQSRPQGVE